MQWDGGSLGCADAYATDTSLSLPLRASAALRQVYALSQAKDRALLDRAWSRAQSLTRQALETMGDSDPAGACSFCHQPSFFPSS